MKDSSPKPPARLAKATPIITWTGNNTQSLLDSNND